MSVKDNQQPTSRQEVIYPSASHVDDSVMGTSWHFLCGEERDKMNKVHIDLMFSLSAKNERIKVRINFRIVVKWESLARQNLYTHRQTHIYHLYSTTQLVEYDTYIEIDEQGT